MIQSVPRTRESWWFTAAETAEEAKCINPANERVIVEAEVWGADGDRVAIVEGGWGESEDAETRARQISLLPDLLAELHSIYRCQECEDGMTTTQDRCKSCDGSGWATKDNWTLRQILVEMEATDLLLGA